MKIFCPECSTSYDLPVSLLGAGRRMRCANCGHIWMQAPVEENRYAAAQPREDLDLIDPIPVSVHPEPASEDTDGPTGPGFLADVNWKGLGHMVAGFLLGWVIICGLLFGLLAMGKLPNAMKPLALAMGMNAGSGLVGLEVQNVTATTAGKTTTVTGKLFNGAAKTRPVPMIELTPVMADGTLGKATEIKPEKAQLKTGETLPFKADMGVTLDSGAGVRVRLLAD